MSAWTPLTQRRISPSASSQTPSSSAMDDELIDELETTSSGSRRPANTSSSSNIANARIAKHKRKTSTTTDKRPAKRPRQETGGSGTASKGKAKATEVVEISSDEDAPSQPKLVPLKNAIEISDDEAPPLQRARNRKAARLKQNKADKTSHSVDSNDDQDVIQISSSPPRNTLQGLDFSGNSAAPQSAVRALAKGDSSTAIPGGTSSTSIPSNNEPMNVDAPSSTQRDPSLPPLPESSLEPSPAPVPETRPLPGSFRDVHMSSPTRELEPDREKSNERQRSPDLRPLSEALLSPSSPTIPTTAPTGTQTTTSSSRISQPPQSATTSPTIPSQPPRLTQFKPSSTAAASTPINAKGKRTDTSSLSRALSTSSPKILTTKPSTSSFVSDQAQPSGTLLSQPIDLTLSDSDDERQLAEMKKQQEKAEKEKEMLGLERIKQKMKERYPLIKGKRKEKEREVTLPNSQAKKREGKGKERAIENVEVIEVPDSDDEQDVGRAGPRSAGATHSGPSASSSANRPEVNVLPPPVQNHEQEEETRLPSLPPIPMDSDDDDLFLSSASPQQGRPAKQRAQKQPSQPTLEPEPELTQLLPPDSPDPPQMSFRDEDTYFGDPFFPSQSASQPEPNIQEKQQGLDREQSFSFAMPPNRSEYTFSSSPSRFGEPDMESRSMHMDDEQPESVANSSNRNADQEAMLVDEEVSPNGRNGTSPTQSSVQGQREGTSTIPPSTTIKPTVRAPSSSSSVQQGEQQSRAARKGGRDPTPVSVGSAVLGPGKERASVRVAAEKSMERQQNDVSVTQASSAAKDSRLVVPGGGSVVEPRRNQQHGNLTSAPAQGQKSKLRAEEKSNDEQEEEVQRMQREYRLLMDGLGMDPKLAELPEEQKEKSSRGEMEVDVDMEMDGGSPLTRSDVATTGLGNKGQKGRKGVSSPRPPSTSAATASTSPALTPLFLPSSTPASTISATSSRATPSTPAPRSSKVDTSATTAGSQNAKTSATSKAPATRKVPILPLPPLPLPPRPLAALRASPTPSSSSSSSASSSSSPTLDATPIKKPLNPRPLPKPSSHVGDTPSPKSSSAVTPSSSKIVDLSKVQKANKPRAAVRPTFSYQPSPLSKSSTTLKNFASTWSSLEKPISSASSSSSSAPIRRVQARSRQVAKKSTGRRLPNTGVASPSPPSSTDDVRDSASTPSVSSQSLSASTSPLSRPTIATSSKIPSYSNATSPNKSGGGSGARLSQHSRKSARSAPFLSSRITQGGSASAAFTSNSPQSTPKDTGGIEGWTSLSAFAGPSTAVSPAVSKTSSPTSASAPLFSAQPPPKSPTRTNTNDVIDQLAATSLEPSKDKGKGRASFVDETTVNEPKSIGDVSASSSSEEAMIWTESETSEGDSIPVRRPRGRPRKRPVTSAKKSSSESEGRMDVDGSSEDEINFLSPSRSRKLRPRRGLGDSASSGSGSANVSRTLVASRSSTSTPSGSRSSSSPPRVKGKGEKGSFQYEIYGGRQALTWASFRHSFLNTPPPYKKTTDLISSFHDQINLVNSFSHVTRDSPYMRLAFQAMIETNTLDEPEAPPIEIYNDIDCEPCPPWEFFYTNEYYHGKNVRPPTRKGLTGCGCVGDCGDAKNKGKCACWKKQVKFQKLVREDADFIYDENGRIRLEALRSVFPVFECNELCGCGEACRNRLVQHGRKHRVAIKKTKDKGWGAFASEFIPAGTFIGIYSGELITEDEADQRGRYYDAYGRTYLYEMDFYFLRGTYLKIISGQNVSKDEMTNPHGGEDEEKPEDYSVDAFHAGNFTRFLNHSCDPNCRATAVYISDTNVYKPNLVFFARKDVRSGEELTFAYTGKYPDDDDYGTEESESDEEVSRTKGKGHGRCQCGAKICKRPRLFL